MPSLPAGSFSAQRNIGSGRSNTCWVVEAIRGIQLRADVALSARKGCSAGGEVGIGNLPGIDTFAEKTIDAINALFLPERVDCRFEDLAPIVAGALVEATGEFHLALQFVAAGRPFPTTENVLAHGDG